MKQPGNNQSGESTPGLIDGDEVELTLEGQTPVILALENPQPVDMPENTYRYTLPTLGEGEELAGSMPSLRGHRAGRRGSWGTSRTGPAMPPRPSRATHRI